MNSFVYRFMLRQMCGGAVERFKWHYEVNYKLDLYFLYYLCVVLIRCQGTSALLLAVSAENRKPENALPLLASHRGDICAICKFKTSSEVSLCVHMP